MSESDSVLAKFELFGDIIDRWMINSVHFIIWAPYRTFLIDSNFELPGDAVAEDGEPGDAVAEDGEFLFKQ